VAFEVTGNPAAVKLMTDAVGCGARSASWRFTRSHGGQLYPMFARELTMQGTRLYARTDWEEAIRLAASGAVPWDRWSATRSLEDSGRHGAGASRRPGDEGAGRPNRLIRLSGVSVWSRLRPCPQRGQRGQPLLRGGGRGRRSSSSEFAGEAGAGTCIALLRPRCPSPATRAAIRRPTCPTTGVFPGPGGGRHPRSPDAPASEGARLRAQRAATRRFTLAPLPSARCRSWSRARATTAGGRGAGVPPRVERRRCASSDGMRLSRVLRRADAREFMDKDPAGWQEFYDMFCASRPRATH
jgi:hypothetical protein